MIRSPLGLRLNASPDRSLKDQLREAARLGAKGVVLDATGDLTPDRLSDTGRRELRHVLRAIELDLIALHLPTRRPFDTEEQLDDRLARAARACALAYDLGCRLVLARLGGVPPEVEAPRREVFTRALRDLGRGADRRGVRLAVETGAEPGEVLRGLLDGLDDPGLAASIDPAALLRQGHDPVSSTRALGPWVAHAYATEATGAGPAGRLAAHPRGFAFPAGVLDWEEYLGALEEIDYRGYLTIWPDPALDPGPQFTTMAARLSRF